jgi:hypothetical protein
VVPLKRIKRKAETSKTSKTILPNSADSPAKMTDTKEEYKAKVFKYIFADNMHDEHDLQTKACGNLRMRVSSKPRHRSLDERNKSGNFAELKRMLCYYFGLRELDIEHGKTPLEDKVIGDSWIGMHYLSDVDDPTLVKLLPAGIDLDDIRRKVKGMARLDFTAGQDWMCACTHPIEELCVVWLQDKPHIPPLVLGNVCVINRFPTLKKLATIQSKIVRYRRDDPKRICLACNATLLDFKKRVQKKQQMCDDDCVTSLKARTCVCCKAMADTVTEMNHGHCQKCQDVCATCDEKAKYSAVNDIYLCDFHREFDSCPTCGKKEECYYHDPGVVQSCDHHKDDNVECKVCGEDFYHKITQYATKCFLCAKQRTCDDCDLVVPQQLSFPQNRCRPCHFASKDQAEEHDTMHPCEVCKDVFSGPTWKKKCPSCYHADRGSKRKCNDDATTNTDDRTCADCGSQLSSKAPSNYRRCRLCFKKSMGW